ncbi:MAG: homoserine dehydrogenase [Kiritimatiellia bacterium]
MESIQEIGIGILGLGNIGAGVADLILNGESHFRDGAQFTLRLRRVADLNLDPSKVPGLDPAICTTDAMQVIHDPAVQVIVELIGGSGVARKFILEAFRAGKSVVTANKALLAEHGPELYKSAEKHGVDLCFEASVGGGIPVIKAIREGLAANRIEKVVGILNGTCNYILTAMEREGRPFDDILREAQQKGYAEAEPSLDVDGTDTAHKVCVLGTIAFGRHVPMTRLPTSGIRHVSPVDIQYARELGYAIKLLGVLKRGEHGVEARVQAALVPREHLLANIHGVFNGVLVTGDRVGDTLYYGRGAGRNPTASAVVADLLDIARDIVSGCVGRMPPVPRGSEEAPTVTHIDDVVAPFYIRVHLLDQTGTLAKLTSVFSRHNIGLDAVVGKKQDPSGTIPTVLMTQPTSVKVMRGAIQALEKTSIIMPGSALTLVVENLK